MEVDLDGVVVGVLVVGLVVVHLVALAAGNFENVVIKVQKTYWHLFVSSKT